MKGRRLLDAMAYIDDDLIEEAAPFGENHRAGSAAKWRRMAACAAVFSAAAVSLWAWKSGIVTNKEIEPENAQFAGGMESGSALEENAPETPSAAANAVDWNVASDNGGAAVSGGAADGFQEENLQENVQQAVWEYDEEKKSVVRVIEEFPPKWEAADGAKSNDYSIGVTEECYKAPEKGQFFLHKGLKSAIDYWDNANNTIELAEPEDYIYHVAVDVFGDVTKDGDMVYYEGLQFSDEGKKKLHDEYERMVMAGLEVSLSEDFRLTGMLSREELEGFEPCAEYGYAFRLINE